MEVINWHGLYKQGWGKLIVPEAYQHPAKFSRGLIEKIYDFCTEKGYLQRQGTVLDCFGGIGTGGIIAMLKGYNHISVELEPRFVELARENFKHIEERYGALVKGKAVILQGDSRALGDVLGQAQVDGIITSPAYASSRVDVDYSDNPNAEKYSINAKQPGNAPKVQYGDSPGQLGAMAEGDFDAVITSAPYANQPIAHYNSGVKASGGLGLQYRLGNNPGGQKQVGDTNYGNTEGQLGAMAEGDFDAVITSSPFGQAQTGGGIAKTGTPEMRKYKNTIASPGYIVSGTSPGQIANLPEGDIQAIITSPSYEDMVKSGEGTGASNARLRASSQVNYGTSPGQIGQQSGDTYWDSVAQVYQECFHILKPGGIICVVVKSFVRRGQLVNLPDMTLKLLEHIGFIPLHYIKAWLVEKGDKQHRLDGKVKQGVKERKGFFRRLKERNVRAANYWPTLSREVQARYLWQAKPLMWQHYRDMLTRGETLSPPVRPTKANVTFTAQVMALEDYAKDGNDIRQFDDETIIDYEVVLCLQKP
tara:strand:+ start:5557 stop:7155 length:1599 start_codon:yes stop_codon:yes gene_type:complete